MPRVTDAKYERAGELARRLLIGHATKNPMTVDRVNEELMREDDQELFMLVLGRATEVATDIVVLLAARVGANPRRTIEDAFDK